MIADYEAAIETWSSLIFLGVFAVEIVRLLLKKRMTWTVAGDSLASFLTFGFFVVITYGLLVAAYVSAFYWAYLNFALLDIPVTLWSVALLLLLCDFAYYWEHRFTHRVGLAWATHSVHHSSPEFNISVAYRFGPMDGCWPIFFHLPLAVIGFDPLLIFACEAFVQFYQTGLHTRLIDKLPRPVEWLMNTPSHHRVHHGSNPEYLDKNYGGILIVWDRLFGTFAQEQSPVRFGLTEQIDSVNPLVVFFHGIGRLFKRMGQSRDLGEALYAVVAPPEWKPGEKRLLPQAMLLPVAFIGIAVVGLASLPGVAQTPGQLPEPVSLAVEPTVGAGHSNAQQVTDNEAVVRALIAEHYAASFAGNDDMAYRTFDSDAFLHYKLDMGPGYGVDEYGFKLSEISYDSTFTDYVASDQIYTVRTIDELDGKVVVTVDRREQYVREGYSGAMQGEDVVSIEMRTGVPVVTRLSSSLVYR